MSERFSKLSAEHPEVINADGGGPVLVICDHASNRVPAPLGDLGLSERQLADHIAWDIGAEAMTRALARRLNAPAVIATVSRLVVDLNREPTSPTLIPQASDGVAVPGNNGLDDRARQSRIDAYHTPFHTAVEHQLEAMLARGHRPVVVAMHSFTPTMDGAARPWEIGFLYKHDPRLAHGFMDVLSSRYAFSVGDNEPYSGHELYYTMERHGQDRGLPQTTVEIRNDEIRDAAGVARWTDIMVDCLTDLARRFG